MMRTVVACLLGSALFVTACSNKAPQIKPIWEPITESVYASGIVKSEGQYEVFANASGTISQVLVKEGDAVRQGMPLFQLSDRTASLNTENARIAATFASRQANAARLQEQQVNIEQAAATLRNDSLLWERQQKLWAENIGSRNQLEQRELAYQTSRRNHETARLRLADLQRQLSLQEQQSGNSLQMAQSLRGDYTVRSEVSGRVYNIMKEQGEMVTPQTPVAVIGGSGAFLLELQVDEFDIVRVKTGMKILVTMDSYKGHVFEAQVQTVDPWMNQRTKTFTVKAHFVQSPPVLYPNLTCEANIVLAEKQRGLTIPASCVVEGEYVLLRSKEKRKITIGMRDYQKVEVLQGLTPNDIILKPGL
jgi:multidrug efflux pump subunit AcrA (membrane-fusion protein)